MMVRTMSNHTDSATSVTSPKTLVVIGIGPGLGLSIARRFGGEGYTVAMLSRTADRHPGYLATLEADGIRGASYVADARDTRDLARALDAVVDDLGRIDLVYYGPGAEDPTAFPRPVLEATASDLREAMRMVYPALELTQHVLPGMLERKAGGLLFAGGLGAVVTLPFLGALASSAAALRTYALNLNAALSDTGVYAGTLIIGGLVARGDIHRHASSDPEFAEAVQAASLDPDQIADAAWRLFSARDQAEATFSALRSD
jgi:NADP-dependent 3-hydroxy acid dehydrogenase YdfG